MRPIVFRDPENALMPNWLHIPIGHNARARSVVASGSEVRRPLGQPRPPGVNAPVCGPCGKLAIDLEMGVGGGAPSDMGAPISVAEADSMIFGYVLLNDWNARDVQVRKYKPLGPFQSKTFATIESPRVVTQPALEPFPVPGPVLDPEPLPSLRREGAFNFDVHLSASLRPPGAHEPATFCRTNFRHMYWSSAQELVHHAVGGCGMHSGDLLLSGTISGSVKDSVGGLLERTWNGTEFALKGGGVRTFDEDGDTLALAKSGDAFVIHACCRNSSRADLDEGQWRDLAEVIAARRILPLIDITYQGLGDGLLADVAGPRVLVLRLDEVLVGASCSKSFGLHRDRAGVATRTAATPAAHNLATGRLAAIAREPWSMPPNHGASVVARILITDGLREALRNEPAAMRRRMNANRHSRAETLCTRLDAGRFDFLGSQNGMFSLLGLDPAGVDALRNGHPICMPANRRINVAGPSESAIEKRSAAIAGLRSVRDSRHPGGGTRDER